MILKYCKLKTISKVRIGNLTLIDFLIDESLDSDASQPNISALLRKKVRRSEGNYKKRKRGRSRSTGPQSSVVTKSKLNYKCSNFIKVSAFLSQVPKYLETKVKTWFNTFKTNFEMLSNCYLNMKLKIDVHHCFRVFFRVLV